MKLIILIICLLLTCTSAYPYAQRVIVNNAGTRLEVDPDGDLPISQTGESVVTGQVILDTPGTAKVFGSSQAVSEILVTSLATLNGNVFVGSSTVSDQTGLLIATNSVYLIRVNNITDLYMDGENQGEGVSYMGIVE